MDFINSFGVLVKNNISNKAVFPAGIPPPFINNNNSAIESDAAWLFPVVPTYSETQHENLESAQAKTQQDDQDGQENRLCSPHQETRIIMSELENALPEEGDLQKVVMENGNSKETLRIESPGLSGFDYQDPPGIGTMAQSSSSPVSGFSSWSTAIPTNPSAMMEEVGFLNQAATTTNASPLLFQNFSHHASSAFGGNFSHQIGPVTQHHLPPSHFHHHHNQHQLNRRSPAHLHPSPFNQRNAAFSQTTHLGNNLNKLSSLWGGYQTQSSFPTVSSSSWSPGGGYGGWGGSPGREYRRGLNGGVNNIHSVSPLKKSFPNSQTSSLRYSRNSSDFNLKPWMENGVNRNDNYCPFQVRNPLNSCFILIYLIYFMSTI